MQSVPLPLTGDDNAIKKYAQDVEALKKKIGVPDYEDLINAELDYKFACSGYDVKAFLAAALEDVKLSGDLEAVAREMNAAVEEAEKSSGRPLDASNEKGWATLATKIQAIEKKHGMTDKAKVREEAVFDLYKKHISGLRTAVQEDVGKVQAAEGLDYIKADLSKLKPKLA